MTSKIIIQYNCRILGFYRAPPVVGRNINLEDEIEPIADKRLLDTFFKKGKIYILTNKKPGQLSNTVVSETFKSRSF